MTERDAVDYYILKWGIYKFFNELGEKSPFGKERQAFGGPGKTVSNPTGGFVP